MIDTFRLPDHAWTEYYDGLDAALRDAVARHGEHDVYTALRHEIDVRAAHGDEYGYLCLILQAPA